MSPVRKVLIALSAVLLLVGAWLGWRHSGKPWRPERPELATPSMAVAHLKGRKVFAVGPARDAIAKSHAEWIPEAARMPLSPLARSIAQATQDPQLFRKLDREIRFDELCLSGEPSSFKPLIEHLLETRDFGPVWVDHTSIVLRRGGDANAPLPAFDEVRALAKEPRETAFLLSQVAARVIALRRNEDAQKLLKEAEKASSAVPDVWTGWAALRMARGEWDKALDAADKALSLDPEHPSAIGCKAQALYATKKFNDAWKYSSRLVKQNPNDPAVLFYHAKLAHEARAFDAEVDALTHLIALAEAANANVSGYRIYLAQAYAAKNDAENAKDQVTLALLDTTLPKEQRVFADELLEQIIRVAEKKQ